MRDNPWELRQAVTIAMEKQNLRKRFNLRTGRQFEEGDGREITPMDVSAARQQYYCNCKRRSHTVATYNERSTETGKAP